MKISKPLIPLRKQCKDFDMYKVCPTSTSNSNEAYIYDTSRKMADHGGPHEDNYGDDELIINKCT